MYYIFIVRIDDRQDPLSVSGSRPTTPVISTSSGTSVVTSVTPTAPSSSSSDTTTVSSGNSIRRKGDKYMHTIKNTITCVIINKYVIIQLVINVLSINTLTCHFTGLKKKSSLAVELSLALEKLDERADTRAEERELKRI